MNIGRQNQIFLNHSMQQNSDDWVKLIEIRNIINCFVTDILFICIGPDEQFNRPSTFEKAIIF